MRSTGVTVSTFSGFAARRKLRYRETMRSCFFSSSTSAGGALPNEQGSFRLANTAFRASTASARITVHVVASRAW